MRVVVVGMGGIGNAVARLLTEQGDGVFAIGRATLMRPEDIIDVDAVVCCNGSHTAPMADCYERTRDWVRMGKIFIAMSGGGVGGPPPKDQPRDYVAAKAALAAFIEWQAVTDVSRQFFCVAPGLTATKMTNYRGADPSVPAAFIVKLLSGKYGRLSGSLLAAQRDNLDTMKPMKLRRVET